MPAEIHDSPDAISALADEWRKLLDADPAAGVFHSPEFAHLWWTEFGGGRALRLVEIRENGALVGIAPMSLEPGRALRFLGDLETTDYLGPVSRPEDRDAVAEALVDVMPQVGDWGVCELHGLAADSGWPEALERAARARGLSVSVRQQEVCPRVSLAGGHDAYLQRLPGKLRHEIRRKARRYEREVGGFTTRLSDAASLEADLDRFFAMHRASEGPKGKFLHEGMASFFARFARMLMAAGDLRLVFLETDGVVHAGAYCFVDDSTWAVYNSAYDHRYRHLGPGMVLVGEVIRIAADSGCGTFDFLRGSEEYKYRFGAQDLPLLELTLHAAGAGE